MRASILFLVLMSLLLTIYGELTAKCWRDSDCDERECCAGKAYKKPGICIEQPQLDQKCNPYIHPASKKHCPCALGTTCTKYYGFNFNTQRFKCTKIIPEEIEIYAPK